MKLTRAKLRDIIKEELGTGENKKTIHISEAKLRKVIREEYKSLFECGCELNDTTGSPIQVDKHGSLSNPPQKPLERAQSDEFMHPMPILGMEEVEDEEDDLLYDVGF